MKPTEVKYWVALSLPVAALGAAQPLYASGSTQIERRAASEINVLSGGVGVDARAKLASATREHDLKLVFAAASGEYLADIPVRIADASGKTILDQVSQGPWMLVQLPPGHYTVQAKLNGSSRMHQVTLSAGGQKTVYFRWPQSDAQSAGQAMITSPPQNQVTGSSAASSDARPIEDLQAAAQRLRDAIHDMAQAPAGPQRVTAIQAGDRALRQVNDAMANLPPELLTAAATESEYRQSIDRLQQASDQLRKAAQALATDSNSPRRNETIRDINRALLDIQQVMIDIPLSAWNRQPS